MRRFLEKRLKRSRRRGRGANNMNQNRIPGSPAPASPERTHSENLAKLPTLRQHERTFFQLVKTGDLTQVKDFMMDLPNFEDNVNINVTDMCGYSALHYAVRRQDEAMVEHLLETTNIKVFDTLYHAIEVENEEITKKIKNKLNPDPTNNAEKRKSRDTVATDDFDSAYPSYIHPFQLAAQKGNPKLMKLFYNRDIPEECLESLEKHHNRRCPCIVCLRTIENREIISEKQRMELFSALTNPQYICFICKQEPQWKLDPVSYALNKIKKCKELKKQEVMYAAKYEEFIATLSEFIKDMVDLCQTTDEAQIFFSFPERPTKGRLTNKLPRLWTIVRLKLVDVVAHPNTQLVAYNQWLGDWHSWNTYGGIRKFTEFLFRFVLIFPYVIILWFGGDNKFTKKLRSPLSRYMNWVVSYIYFLGVLGFQIGKPQRCNNDGTVPYTVQDKDCDERGPPNVGTEWILVAYVTGIWVSMLKGIQIPWHWKSAWTRYTFVTNLAFNVAFGLWLASWIKPHDAREPITDWDKYSLELVGSACFGIAAVLAYCRIYTFLTLNRSIGAMQVGFGYVMKKCFVALFPFVIVIFSFSIGLAAIYVPFDGIKGYTNDRQLLDDTQNSPYADPVRSLENLFWALHGPTTWTSCLIIQFPQELNGNFTDPKTLKHPYYSETAGLWLFGCYLIFGRLIVYQMLGSYLVGLFDNFVPKDARYAQWKMARTVVYLTYMKETVLPPPFNLIPTLHGLKQLYRYIELKVQKTTNGGDTTGCSLAQCCYIKIEVSENIRIEQEKKRRHLTLNLIHRYKNLTDDRIKQSLATNEDVRQLGEELVELKAELEMKLAQIASQVTPTTTTTPQDTAQQSPVAPKLPKPIQQSETELPTASTKSETETPVRSASVTRRLFSPSTFSPSPPIPPLQSPPAAQRHIITPTPIPQSSSGPGSAVAPPPVSQPAQSSPGTQRTSNQTAASPTSPQISPGTQRTSNQTSASPKSPQSSPGTKKPSNQPPPPPPPLPISQPTSDAETPSTTAHTDENDDDDDGWLSINDKNLFSTPKRN